MSDDIIAALKEKFDQYALWDVAKEFFIAYKLDMQSGNKPEIRFVGNQLPSDECFRTLLVMRNTMMQKYPRAYRHYFRYGIVRKILEIPYSRVVETASEICRYTGISDQEVVRWYREEKLMFFVTKEKIQNYITLVSPVFGEDVCKAMFKDAIILEPDDLCLRLNTLIECTDTHADYILQTLYLKRIGNVCMFDSNLYKMPEAVTCLREHFDEETTAFIIISKQWFFTAYSRMQFKDMHASKTAAKYVNDVIINYDMQIKASDELEEILQLIFPESAEKLWNESFIPVYEKIKKFSVLWQYCPKLKRALLSSVTMFDMCGIDIPDDLKKYIMQ